jgi:hypothetical protein
MSLTHVIMAAPNDNPFLRETREALLSSAKKHAALRIVDAATEGSISEFFTATYALEAVQKTLPERFIAGLARGGTIEFFKQLSKSDIMQFTSEQVVRMLFIYYMGGWLTTAGSSIANTLFKHTFPEGLEIKIPCTERTLHISHQTFQEATDLASSVAPSKTLSSIATNACAFFARRAAIEALSKTVKGAMEEAKKVPPGKMTEYHMATMLEGPV